MQEQFVSLNDTKKLLLVHIIVKKPDNNTCFKRNKKPFTEVLCFPLGAFQFSQND